MISLKTIAAICLGATLCMAQTINIRGVVKDTADNGISGAMVTLQNQDISATTEEDGSFTLAGTLEANPPDITAHATVSSRILVQNGRITFALSKSSPVVIRIHDVGGRLLYSKKSTYGPGTQTLQMPPPPAGIHLYWVNIGNDSYSFKSSPLGSISTQRGAALGGTSLLAKQAQANAVIADVISVVKEGQLNYRDSIKTTDTSGIVIKMIPNAGDVTDADGNVYQSVRIGKQVWTVENWRCTKYSDSTEIALVTEPDESGETSGWRTLIAGAYCNYDNNAANKVNYGALYNWFVVNPANAKSIAPDGWSVPTDAQWDTLKTYLIENGYNWDRTATANEIAKSMASRTDWSSYAEPGTIGYNLTKNNRSGFSALPGGFRSFDGTFRSQSSSGYWWSATDNGASNAFNRNLSYSSEGLIRGNYGKQYGFSIRLVRDSEPDPCDGVTELTINVPVDGTVVTVGQATTIEWCYGSVYAVMIFFENNNGVRTKLNPDPSRQVTDVTSVSWTPTAEMIGTGYIIIHAYVDPDLFAVAQVTVQ